MRQVIIDVREKEEFKADRIEGSINLPLSDLGHQAPGVLKALSECSFLLMCRSGKRAQLAKKQLEALGLGCEIQVYEGGILAWKKQGKSTECSGQSMFPVMRQVQLVAGFLVAFGAALSWFIDPRWLALPAFVGLGLITAGATGFCGMAELLIRMPWNRSAIKSGSASTGSGSGCGS